MGYLPRSCSRARWATEEYWLLCFVLSGNALYIQFRLTGGWQSHPVISSHQTIRLISMAGSTYVGGDNARSLSGSMWRR
jgi:hypothetical protein